MNSDHKMVGVLVMTTHELWQAVLGELELSLSKANFTTWFKSTFVAEIGASDACIGVPNLFTKAWLEKKYHKEILQSLQNLTDERVRTVSYRVEARPTGVQIIDSIDPAPLTSTITTHQEANEIPPFATESVRIPSFESGEFTLNGKYTFSSFIVGKQNELAHAAAQAVSGNPGGVYNPLFLYGGVGLGKTHLLQAVGNELLRKNPTIKVLYVTSERFTNDYIQAVRSGKTQDFKNRYRNIDLLLVDDIQFIAGKESTQEEFFHTFNHLYQSNKQIVLTSDRPPKAIQQVEHRLVSRFECGMLADVGNPDYETRVAILESKCRDKNYPLDRDVMHHLATIVQSNVRELEGALNKIIAFHQFKNTLPSLESVKPILSSFNTQSQKKSVTPKILISTVAVYFDVAIEDLLGKSREKRLAFPRQIVMYLMREELKSSYPSIGNELGGRDHTTAMHAYEKICNCLSQDEKLQHDMELIKQRLYTAA